MSDKIKNKI